MSVILLPCMTTHVILLAYYLVISGRGTFWRSAENVPRRYGAWLTVRSCEVTINKYRSNITVQERTSVEKAASVEGGKGERRRDSWLERDR